jgi:hypothetical protein
VILLFSQMIGALVLQIAGRLDQLQTDPFSLLRILLGQLRALPLMSVEDSCRGADRSKAKEIRILDQKRKIGRTRNDTH